MRVMKELPGKGEMELKELMRKEMEEMSKKVLTYEEYYGEGPMTETKVVRETRNILGHSRKDTKYEDFLT